MKNIAIIGSGQLGSRHLQALNLINRTINIYVIDPNQNSLDVAKERFYELPRNENITNIFFKNSIDYIDNEIDIGIVATASDVRRKVVEELISKKRVKYLLLEKVLFQQIEDYEFISNILSNNGIKSWVNCSRRMYDFYIELKKTINASHIYEINISGSNWGLGCNSIHFIDLASYLTVCTNYTLKTEKLNEIESKRKGFIEFTGTIKANFENGTNLTLESFPNDNIPINIKIVAEDVIIIIDEMNGKMFLSKQNNQWKWEIIDFRLPYQSEITQLVVESILDTGKCLLTPYEESSQLHLPMIKSFINFLNNKKNSKEIKICPIT